MNTIITNSLTKYYGSYKGIENINLTINEGEIFGFIGKNGAGKSTFIKTILNLLYPTNGSATINNCDIVTKSINIKEFVAFVPAEISLYNLKISDIINFYMKSINKTDKKLVEELCKYFELDVSKNYSQLSLGNKKKVSIVLALLKEAKIIILDEPTSGLDPIIQDKLFSYLLKEKKKGKTIFISSHNLHEVEKYCDRVAIIKNGSIVKEFVMQDLLLNQKHSVIYVLENGKTYEEKFDDINDIIKKLSKLKLKSCTIYKVSVEDELKKYYLGD